MKIIVIGTGFVGVVSSAVYAQLGHNVVGLDVDEKKIKQLTGGKVPFFEPELDDLVKQGIKSGNLKFSTNYQESISDADLVILAVGTPSAPDGQADLKYLYSAVDSMAKYLPQGVIIAIKSTVPPGTNQLLFDRLKSKTSIRFDVASLPEFLREGSAVSDTLNPDRVIIGSTNKRTIELLTKLHSKLTENILVMSPQSAQMSKYASNAYLATRITFINQIADLCERNGASVAQVIAGMSQDRRIGSHYWYPGLGYGGSCFPKDVRELASYSRSVEEHNSLFIKIDELNSQRPYRMLEKFSRIVGGFENKTVAVLGLSFKPNTDDTREAPSQKVIPYLLSKGASVRAYDPMAKYSLSQPKPTPNFSQFQTLAGSIDSADVIMILIEWDEFKKFDFSKIKKDKPQTIIDTRLVLDRSAVEKVGFRYIGVGIKN